MCAVRVQCMVLVHGQEGRVQWSVKGRLFGPVWASVLVALRSWFDRAVGLRRSLCYTLRWLVLAPLGVS